MTNWWTVKVMDIWNGFFDGPNILRLYKVRVVPYDSGIKRLSPTFKIGHHYRVSGKCICKCTSTSLNGVGFRKRLKSGKNLRK